MTLALLALAGCREAPIDPPGSDPLASLAHSGRAAHSGRPEPELTGYTASFLLRERAPDAEEPGWTTLGRALFASESGGVLNLAGCVLAGDPCVADLGSPGDLLPPVDTSFLGSADLADAGPTVTAGGPLERSFAYGVPVYVGAPPYPGSAALAWDGELAAHAGEGGWGYAGSLRALAPDPTLRLLLRPGGAAELRWEPGGAGEVILRVGGALRHLEDDGEESIPAEELGLVSPVDSGELALSRRRVAILDASGTEARVETASEQVFHVDWEDAVGWTGLSVGAGLAEDCPGAAALAPVGPGRYVGDLAGARDDHDLGTGNDLTGWPTAGADAALRVSAPAGSLLTLVFRQPRENASIYLLGADCDPRSAPAGADRGGAGDPERLELGPLGPDPVTVVLDGAVGGGDWSLEILEP